LVGVERGCIHGALERAVEPVGTAPLAGVSPGPAPKFPLVLFLPLVSLDQLMLFFCGDPVALGNIVVPVMHSCPWIIPGTALPEDNFTEIETVRWYPADGDSI